VRLLLLRHGRTAWNDAGRFQGQADPPLDSTGQAQAAGVAPVIQALHPDLVVSSDLRRCQATAAAIGLPYESDPRLREIDLGAWSGLDAVEVSRRFPEQDAAWRRGEDVRRGGGETYSEVAARAGELFDELVTAGRPATPNGLIVFVLHSGTARSLIGHLLGLPPDAWWHFGPIGNCRWSLLRREHGRFRLSAHNVGLTPADSVRPGTSAAAAGTLLPTQEPPTATDDEPVHSPRQH
jgi:probable phosphoglycerate mutase